jgi:hypothetical protein
VCLSMWNGNESYPAASTAGCHTSSRKRCRFHCAPLSFGKTSAVPAVRASSCSLSRSASRAVSGIAFGRRLLVVEVYTITGGTGRFADATGTFTGEIIVTQATGVSSGTLSGVIDH